MRARVCVKNNIREGDPHGSGSPRRRLWRLHKQVSVRSCRPVCLPVWRLSGSRWRPRLGQNLLGGWGSCVRAHVHARLCDGCNPVIIALRQDSDGALEF